MTFTSTTPDPCLKGDGFHLDAVHTRRADASTKLLEAAVARRVWAGRDVGDSVLYRSLLGLASCKRFGVTCPKCRLSGNLTPDDGEQVIRCEKPTKIFTFSTFDPCSCTAEVTREIVSCLVKKEHPNHVFARTPAFRSAVRVMALTTTPSFRGRSVFKRLVHAMDVLCGLT